MVEAFKIRRSPEEAASVHGAVLAYTPRDSRAGRMACFEYGRTLVHARRHEDNPI